MGEKIIAKMTTQLLLLDLVTHDTPNGVHFKRKSQSQLKRDKTRRQYFVYRKAAETGQCEPFLTHHHHHHHHHLSLKREGRWGAIDGFTTSFLHFSLFSTALLDLANSRPVHSLMLSSHLFLCLPCHMLHQFVKTSRVLFLHVN